MAACADAMYLRTRLIERKFNLVHQEWQFPAPFNVAPTQQVPILREVAGERRGANRALEADPVFRTGCGTQVFDHQRPY